MKRIFTLLLLTFFTLPLLQGQDIHYSQFWNSPLTLGPAQTGNMDCTFRAGVIYRSQWNSIKPPYKTFSASYEHKFSGLWKGDEVAGGIVFYNDRAGESNFTTNYFSLSGAYHKAIGVDHRLSIGLQAGFAQKSYDFSGLEWADMYNNGTFSLPTSENPGVDNLNNMDFNTGLQWTSLISQDLQAYLGTSFYHLTQPQESFVGTLNKWPLRYAVYGGADYTLNAKTVISPKFLYQGQAKAAEVVVGSAASYQLDNPNFPAKVHAGLFMRYAPGISGAVDAVYPYAGISYKQFKFALSYDVNLSGLTAATNGRGGFELSLQYCGFIEPKPIRIVVPCLRF